MNDFANSLVEAWPWFIVIFFLLWAEFYSLWTQYAHKHWPEKYPKPPFQITLSRMYWRGHKRFPLLDPLMLSVLSWLVPHLLVGDFNGAAEWAWTIVLVLATWITYFTLRKKAANGSS